MRSQKDVGCGRRAGCRAWSRAANRYLAFVYTCLRCQQLSTAHIGGKAQRTGRFCPKQVKDQPRGRVQKVQVLVVCLSGSRRRAVLAKRAILAPSEAASLVGTGARPGKTAPGLRRGLSGLLACHAWRGGLVANSHIGNWTSSSCSIILCSYISIQNCLHERVALSEIHCFSAGREAPLGALTTCGAVGRAAPWGWVAVDSGEGSFPQFGRCGSRRAADRRYLLVFL